MFVSLTCVNSLIVGCCFTNLNFYENVSIIVSSIHSLPYTHLMSNVKPTLSNISVVNERESEPFRFLLYYRAKHKKNECIYIEVESSFSTIIRIIA